MSVKPYAEHATGGYRFLLEGITDPEVFEGDRIMSEHEWTPSGKPGPERTKC